MPDSQTGIAEEVIMEDMAEEIIPEGGITVGEHLAEMRRRVIIAVSVYLFVFIAVFAKGNDITRFISSLGKNAGYNIVYIAPQEILIQELKIASISALVVTFPLIFYQIMAFITPAFESKKTIKWILMLFFFGVIMLCVGSGFAIKVLLPFTFAYFKGIGDATGIAGQVSYANYVSLLVTLTSAVAMAFELPVVCIVLCKMGIVSAKGLSKARPFIVVGVFLLAAIITPPDVFTQFMIAIPMCILYEVSVLICKIIGEKKKTEGDIVFDNLQNAEK